MNTKLHAETSKEVTTMIALTEEQLDELHLAVAARARSTGHGTRNHETCRTILDKLVKGKDQLLGQKTLIGLEPFRQEEHPYAI